MAGESPGGADGDPDDLIALGVLRGAYGLQGWTHVQPFSADAGVLRAVRQWWLLQPERALSGSGGSAGTAALAPGARPLVVTGVRAQGAALVAKWQGCDQPESAQALRGWQVAVSRAQFPRAPDGQYYWIDLIGLRVVNLADEDLGVVRELRSNGAHDVLVVQPQPADAPPHLIPMVAAYVEAVQLEQRRIRVDWQAHW